jgi:hypothetical protein
MLLFALGCTGEAPDKDPADSAPADSADTAADDTAVPAATCPPDMVAIPADAPVYCIDRYEARVVDGVAVAEAGELPDESLGYDGSVAACEATPVTDAGGDTVGWKRMATSSEWEDAADGVLGEGGTHWPYGDEFDATACATPLADGTVVLESRQPSGSFARCVGPFGVYDLSGNVWEWADSGFRVDNASWVAARAAEGFDFSLDTDGIRLVSASAPSMLMTQVHGVPDGTVSVAEDGRLYLPEDAVTTTGTQPGYLITDYNADDASDFLLIDLDVESDTEGRVFLLARDEDGAPIPDKRGGAWYTGNSETSRGDNSQMIHHHAFIGTVGFRCAADPMP